MATTEHDDDVALAAMNKAFKVDSSYQAEHQKPLPRTSIARLTASSETTILYLAYGSNLCAETFKGRRGIKPISAVNVHVPSLDLTFDLPGFPYLEPCFANTRYHVENPPKSPYHKDKWTKGLIGVVYEITPEDFRTIIATEGGGSSYIDVKVECFALPDAAKVVAEPTGKGFEAHTLMMPPTDHPLSASSWRSARPIPSYAQPSARYLQLLKTGGEEHALPAEYMDFVRTIRPYKITTAKQKWGRWFIMMFFLPIMGIIFKSGKTFAGKDGKSPAWLKHAVGITFMVVWKVYDNVLVRFFGDGERTMVVEGDEGSANGSASSLLGGKGDADEKTSGRQ